MRKRHSAHCGAIDGRVSRRCVNFHWMYLLLSTSSSGRADKTTVFSMDVHCGTARQHGHLIVGEPRLACLDV